MDANALLAPSLAALRDTTARVVDLLASLPDATAPIRPGTWTVRECAVHLLAENRPGIELARGAPAPFVYGGKEAFNAEGADRISDVPQTDPVRLAEMVAQMVEELIAALGSRTGDAPVDFFGTPMNQTQLVGVCLGEFLVHGWDIATAVGRPWPIDSAAAQLTLYGYTPVFGMCASPRAAGHTAAYHLDMPGGGVVVRFADGAFSTEPPGAGPVDAVLSGDPATFLLVGTGRVSQWQAIGLGLLSAGGPRPDLALGYLDLFDLP